MISSNAAFTAAHDNAGLDITLLGSLGQITCHAMTICPDDAVSAARGGGRGNED